MKGRRLYRNDDDGDYYTDKECTCMTRPVPGDYYRYQGEWYGYSPNGLLAGLAKHRIIEHDDGSITAIPSILVDNSVMTWHGYLEKGNWLEIK